MSDFELYFGLGRAHIMDIQAYDHILFVIALCVVYQVSQWRQVLILITAFTIGHSLTLALAALDVIEVNAEVIEFLIPVTILITAVGNIKNAGVDASKKRMPINYFFALFFGFIHGMGFSNYLKSLLGRSESILTPLFAFNLGLELGQVLIVLLFFGLTFVVHKFLKITRRDWVMIISSAVAGIALILMIETKFW